MRTVSLREAKDRLDELVEEAVAGDEVVISLDENHAVRLEPLRRSKTFSREEKAARKEAILTLLKQIDALPVLDPRSAEEIVAEEYGEDGIFGLTLEVRQPVNEKNVGAPVQDTTEKVRVFGLDQGKCVVPDDFDAPMPELEELFYAFAR